MKIIGINDHAPWTPRTYEVLTHLHRKHRLTFATEALPLLSDVTALSRRLEEHVGRNEFVYVDNTQMPLPLLDHAMRRGYHFGIMEFLQFPDNPIELASVFHVDNITRQLMWLSPDFYDNAHEIFSRPVAEV